MYSITKDWDANEAFVEVTKVTATKSDVTATATIHKATKQGTKPTRATIHKDDDLFELSGRRDLYRGWTVEDIHADLGLVEFGNGQKIAVGASSSQADEQHQRLMLRLAIESHFEKELQLLQQLRRGLLAARIKPLTLFFIERVSDYAPAGSKLREWFGEEYESVRADGRFLGVDMPDLCDVHDGYFAETPKGVPKEARAESKDAAGAFEQIMKRKQDLLGFEEPLRFIFSHSALAEGWDNPNVFTICNLQDGRSTMRKRQQVGRGLRLPVMVTGDRCHVDDVNVLTVIAKESFAKFAETLQQEIEEETGATFAGRIVDLRKKKKLKLKENALVSEHFTELWRRISVRTSYRLDFTTDNVVTGAIERINAMPPIEPVKFRKSKAVVEMGTAGLSGSSAQDRGVELAASQRKIPDVVAELSRRLPLSRATIVRILKGCSRLEHVAVNPAVFIDQVGEAIGQAFYANATRDIHYAPTGESWPASYFKDKHQEVTISPRVVPVERSVTDQIVCDSQVEERFARFLDAHREVPLFLKLPEWFKVTTPLGSYNPDWAFVRETPAGHSVHLVRETKGGSDIDRLRFESEGWKIRFGAAHFDAIGVDYAFGDDPNVLIEVAGATSAAGAATVLTLPAARVVDDVDEDARFTTHLPVYSLEAAAGYFGIGHDVDIEGWIPVDRRVDESMFVTRVVGRSMEPEIRDGALCVFRRIRPGSRQGKRVLAQHHDIADPETGGSFTVKVYESAKEDVDGELQGSVILRPLNPEFERIVLNHIDSEDVLVVAELVEVLG